MTDLESDLFFNYTLPEKLIAQAPSNPRDKSRLMIINKAEQKIQDRVFSDLETILGPDDVLVFNNTEVIPARIFAKKKTGAQIECLLTQNIANNEWLALLKPGKRIKEGDVLFISNTFQIHCLEKKKTSPFIRVKLVSDKPVLDLLNQYGSLPLPPYIKNKSDNADYQTIFASSPGAIAAPTAGLHFSKGLLKNLTQKGVQSVGVTLHVGYGTFKPIDGPVNQHIMHKERYYISESSANQLTILKKKKRLIGIGTTVARTLESAWREDRFIPGPQDTTLFIRPGYTFQTISGLITNFHLPKSTLLLLVSAFGGTPLIQRAYSQAIKNKYRFYSFGDAMFIQ